MAVKEGGGDPALADEIAREHPLPATTGGATPHPLPATVGVSINVIHAEGMSPGSTGIITKLGMILNIFVGGYNSTDNDIMHPLSADRRDISPIDAAMSPGSGKSNNSTGIILGHIFLFNRQGIPVYWVLLERAVYVLPAYKN